MYDSTIFSKFTQLGEHDNNPVLEAFCPSRKISHHLSHTVCFLLPPPKATTNLLCVSVDLPVLDISYNWNHTMCGFLCLAFFTQHVFKVYPCCTYVGVFIALFCWILFHCIYEWHFVYSVTLWWTLGLFPLLIYRESCCCVGLIFMISTSWFTYLSVLHYSLLLEKS